MSINSKDVIINPFFFKINLSSVKTVNDIYLLIHGWTGNENSMSVFLQSLPENAAAIMPRGLFQINQDSYGWANATQEGQHDFAVFQGVAEKLHHAIQSVKGQLTDQEDAKFNLIGFSQGAALAVVYSLLFPHEIRKVALLSGFLPAGSPQIEPGKIQYPSYYIAHGKQDTLVEFQQAVEMKEYLDSITSPVQFCSAEIGHRVSAACLSDLKNFLVN